MNADVGEGGAQDEALFAAGISSANVACGAHAGDEASMAAACTLAARYPVALGAHPGYADREHFGRRAQTLAPRELERLLEDQLAALHACAVRAGVAVAHVKPHGALYHALNRDEAGADVLLGVVRRLLPQAHIVGPPCGALDLVTRRAGLKFVPEGFIDRGYRPDFSLVPRGEPRDVLHDTPLAVAQALSLARSGRVRTLCVHGDGAEATRLLVAARAALLAAGFRISAPA
ncbi:MAG: LamB/YcsF family protein [Opitutaceae bacterium]|nr:LamB/YcsF family protein [Opitutaceae bacterium]